MGRVIFMASTSQYGFMPKLSGDPTDVLRGDGTFGPDISSSAVEGDVTDPAITTDADGTISGKLRGLVKILGDVWDSITHVLRVSVSNFPATQPVSGTVAVSGVSGTVTVDGSGHTQPVSGSVSVSNLPATQPVSGTVAVTNAGLTNLDVALSTVAKESGGNLATIAGKDFATAAKQDTGNTSLSTIAAKDFATATKQDTGNTTLAEIALDTDNLDVALSTRLKPADTLTAVTTVGTITNPVAVTQSTSPWVDNLTQVGGTAIALGQNLGDLSLPVALSYEGIDVLQQILGELRVMRQAMIKLACDDGRAQPDDFTQNNPVDAGNSRLVN